MSKYYVSHIGKLWEFRRKRSHIQLRVSRKVIAVTFICPCFFKGNQKDKSDKCPPNSLAAHSLDLYTPTDFKSYATPLTWFGSPTPDLTIMGKCLILKSQTINLPLPKLPLLLLHNSVHLCLVTCCSSGPPKFISPSLWLYMVLALTPLFWYIIPRLR